VNALAPGFFASEMTEQFDDDYAERIMGHTEMRRLGRAEELAAALLFLVSDAGGYVTGQTIPVDGGLLVGS
jgi:NAD(P)-dependent dehydrogenase (short-subunit alcohol dehydrogenase family)